MSKQNSMIKAKVAWKSVDDTHYIAMKKENMT
jgi:hypothetical protein